MSEPTLKPCPFCGKSGRLFPASRGGLRAYVKCNDDDGCLAKTSECLTNAAAVAAWNQRVSR